MELKYKFCAEPVEDATPEPEACAVSDIATEAGFGFLEAGDLAGLMKLNTLLTVSYDQPSGSFDYCGGSVTKSGASFTLEPSVDGPMHTPWDLRSGRSPYSATDFQSYAPTVSFEAQAGKMYTLVVMDALEKQNHTGFGAAYLHGLYTDLTSSDLDNTSGFVLAYMGPGTPVSETPNHYEFILFEQSGAVSLDAAYESELTGRAAFNLTKLVSKLSLGPIRGISWTFAFNDEFANVELAAFGLLSEDDYCPTCECLGVGGNMSAYTGETNYSASLVCGAWDENADYCLDGGEFAFAPWCNQSWCFVDPASCYAAHPFAGLYYAYSACGAEDYFTGSDAWKLANYEPNAGDTGCDCLSPEAIESLSLNASSGNGLLQEMGYSDWYGASVCDEHDVDESAGGCNDPDTASCWCYGTWCYVNGSTCATADGTSTVSRPVNGVELKYKFCSEPVEGGTAAPAECAATTSTPDDPDNIVPPAVLGVGEIAGIAVAAVLVVVVIIVVAVVATKKGTTRHGTYSKQVDENGTVSVRTRYGGVVCCTTVLNLSLCPLGCWNCVSTVEC